MILYGYTQKTGDDMKKNRGGRILSLLLCICLLGSLLPAARATDNVESTTEAEARAETLYIWTAVDSGCTINTQWVEGEAWLFLPAAADPDFLPLYFDEESEETMTVTGEMGSVSIHSGDIVSLTALCGVQEVWTLQLSCGDAEQRLQIRASGTVASVFLVSDDPENEGRDWVESSPDHSNKTTGSMVLENEDGSIVYSGALTQLRGRGNSTWRGEKRPYQIKLKSKTDLLESGDPANAAKTWVLLADYYDGSLIRNAIIDDLAAELGLEANVEYRFVDLYYDGEYRGNYMLCEKVTISSGVVDITDLEKQTEQANPGITDYDALESATGTTENGATYIYYPDIISPEDVTGGYLLEREESNRAVTEASWFRTSHGNYVIVHSPEYCSQEEMEYIATLYENMENALYHDGTNSLTGGSLWDYLDQDSTAICYLLNEFTKNPDGFTSSAYFYTDTGEGLLHMGPAWDYNLGLGVGNSYYDAECSNPEGWLTSVRNSYGRNLMAMRDFKSCVYKLYTQKLSPLVNDILLSDNGGDASGRLMSLEGYLAETQASAQCNYTVWEIASFSGKYRGGYSYESTVEYLREYTAARITWMDKNLPAIFYSDVSTDKWYTDSIAKVTAAGLMNGVGNGLFEPEGKVTRAQAAQILYRLSGSQPYEGSSAFTDVSPKAWYYSAVNRGAEAGIIQGCGNGKFKPNDEITRQDMVVLLWRYYGNPTADGAALQGFSDAGKVSAYAREAVAWAIDAGILKGYKDETLRPRATITRAEIATVLTRLPDFEF